MEKRQNAINIRETIPAEKVEKALSDLADYLLKKFDFSKEDVAIVGIQRRGAAIAQRVAEAARKKTGADVAVGEIDITLYRDDLSTAGIQPVVGETHLDFDVDNKEIVLIDDVLFTGRTVRAALDEIMDFGRPRRIALVVLIDRGHRELPIEAEFAALRIATKRSDFVDLHLQEIDGREEIVVCEPVK